MAEEQVCKICGNSYKNLGAHVRSAHYMSMDEYDVYLVQDLDKEEIISEEDTNRSDPILDDFSVGENVTEVVINDELSDILKEYNLTKKELIQIIKNYKRKPEIPQSQTPENVAKRLSTEKNPSTISVKVAEILVNKYGFRIKGGGPSTGGGTHPKRWDFYK